MHRLIPLLFAANILVGVASVQADIFQWEYINPADPSQGKRQSTTLAPDGAGVDAEPNANLGLLDLSTAYLDGADLSHANMQGAQLQNASLAKANLFAADFSLLVFGLDPVFHSDLTRANLRQANLMKADFTYATLTDADFTGADVRGATFVYGWWSFPTGITLAQLYSTASYQAHELKGVTLWGHNLNGGNFAGQDLKNADFGRSTLYEADFTGANIRGASFGKTWPHAGGPEGSGISLAQLYSTASYQALDLTGVDFRYNNLAGGSFYAQNLTNASFYFATLTGADLTAADTRGAFALNLGSTSTTNLIRPDGHVAGLDLNANSLFLVRDYDGDERRWWRDSIPPIPITIDQQLTIGSEGTLRMVFESDEWNSTISFVPGIPVTLGGTLELTFAADVQLATQVGRTFDLFDWTGVNPTGTFTVASRYSWDLSNLYTSGEVMLTAVHEPNTAALFVLAIACVVITSARQPHSRAASNFIWNATQLSWFVLGQLLELRRFNRTVRLSFVLPICGGIILPVSAIADIQSPNLWVLHDGDLDYEHPTIGDTLTGLLVDGQVAVTVTGLNIAQTVGGQRAIAVSPFDHSVIVAEGVGGFVRKYDPHVMHVWSVEVGPSPSSVSVAGDGTVYALNGTTIYGDTVTRILSTGLILDQISGGGFDLAIDDARQSMYVVGDSIKYFDFDPTERWSIDPIEWTAVSVDVASDGSAWIAERMRTQVSGSLTRLLHVSLQGTILDVVNLSSDPWCVRVDQFDNSLYATVGETLKKFDSNGQEIYSVPLDSFGWNIAIDEHRDVWVGIWSSVLRLHPDGTGLQTVMKFSRSSNTYLALARNPVPEPVSMTLAIGLFSLFRLRRQRFSHQC